MNVALCTFFCAQSHIHALARGGRRAAAGLPGKTAALEWAAVGAQDAEGVDGEEAAPVPFGGG